MIIAVCDPKGIAIEAIKTILYHDKGLLDRISRIYLLHFVRVTYREATNIKICCLILRPNLVDHLFSNRKSPNFANIRSFLLFLCKLCVKIIDSSLFSN